MPQNKNTGKPLSLGLPPIPTGNPREELFMKIHNCMIEFGNVFMREM
ncbi:MAG: hypothetical protein ABIY51_02825 [Ferruginibacter sp.]